MTAPRTLVLGTAGHVDHGKTSLVRALTGIDTDRLEEEQRRGISIELGFAHLELDGDLRLGIVDVPGHERFVRQMVAGAGGMDLAMLLVAADEGVMPQTREHLDVLRLLGVSSGLVVLTKIDLADPDLVEVVEVEVEELVAETFLAGAPIVRVSSTTGQGLDLLRATLAEVARRAPQRSRAGDFRLPVDRVFVLSGTGVVVTGTAWSGSVATGDTLRLLPQGIDVRVRDVQSHGRTVERAGAGERVALSLHGVKKDDLQRGDQLVGGKAWQASTLVGVRVRAVDDPDLAARMRPRARVHVHHAAREVLGRLDLLEGEGALAPGESRLARLVLEEPIVARPGDRLVLRTYSPMVTAAGGVVIEPHARKGERRAHTLRWLRALHEGDLLDWALAAPSGTRSGRTGSEALARLALCGLDAEAAHAAIETAIGAARFVRIGDRLFATSLLTELAHRALALVRAHQDSQPMTTGLPREELRQTLGFDAGAHVFAQVLDQWATQLPLFVRGDRVRADQAEPQLDDHQQEELARFEARVREAEPLFEATDADLREPALRLLTESGRAVRLEGRLFAHRHHLDRLIGQVASHFASQPSLDIADVKEWTGASRKFVVPLLEWLDRQEVTRFEGGQRRRGPRCP
jgi:selenocysteine-specific elongation factor